MKMVFWKQLTVTTGDIFQVLRKINNDGNWVVKEVDQIQYVIDEIKEEIRIADDLLYLHGSPEMQQPANFLRATTLLFSMLTMGN